MFTKPTSNTMICSSHQEHRPSRRRAILQWLLCARSDTRHDLTSRDEPPVRYIPTHAAKSFLKTTMTQSFRETQVKFGSLDSSSTQSTLWNQPLQETPYHMLQFGKPLVNAPSAEQEQQCRLCRRRTAPYHLGLSHSTSIHPAQAWPTKAVKQIVVAVRRDHQEIQSW